MSPPSGEAHVWCGECQPLPQSPPWLPCASVCAKWTLPHTAPHNTEKSLSSSCCIVYPFFSLFRSFYLPFVHFIHFLFFCLFVNLSFIFLYALSFFHHMFCLYFFLFPFCLILFYFVPVFLPLFCFLFHFFLLFFPLCFPFSFGTVCILCPLSRLSCTVKVLYSCTATYAHLTKIRFFI